MKFSFHILVVWMMFFFMCKSGLAEEEIQPSPFGPPSHREQTVPQSEQSSSVEDRNADQSAFRLDPSPEKVSEQVNETKLFPREGRKLRIAGGAVLGGGYLVSAIIGTIFLAKSDRAGGYFYIPLAGSAVYGIDLAADGFSSGGFGVLEGIIGILTTLPSLAQITGTSLLIAGIVKGYRARRGGENTPGSYEIKPRMALSPCGPEWQPGFTFSYLF